MNGFWCSQGSLHWLNRPGTVVLCCLWLISCSGGISGTGDGGPIVVVDITEGEISSTTSGGNSADSTASIAPVSFSHQVFPQQLTTQFSNALLSAHNLNERIPALSTTPITQKISGQLNNVALQTLRVQLDLANIEEHLLESLLQCNSVDPCSSVPTAITTTLSPDTLNFQLALQADSTLAAPASGDQSSYTNVSYIAETAGYFDQKLQFTNEVGTSVVVRWTTGRQLVSLTIENSTAVTYLLTDFQQSRTTLRTNNTTALTVFHAELQGSAATGTTIEADFNGDEQHYVRASTNENSMILYSIHPTDNTVMRTREAFDLSNGSYVVESCPANNGVCENWQTVSGDESQIASRFTDTETTLAKFSLTLSSSLQVSIPTEVDEFVIANGDGATQPEAGSLVCAGQRVLNAVRSFCWQPLPLATTPQFYEEISGNGATTYRRLPNSGVQ